MIDLVVVPQTPLLVEPFDLADTAELRPVRAAAREAVTALLAPGPGRVVVLATGDDADESAGGDLAPWGVPVRVGGPGAGLSLGQSVGAWLLDDAGWSGPRAYVGDLAEVGDGDAVLVVVDGSTRRTERAPGHLDERAEPFDAAVADALERGDATALRDLDLSLARDLGADAAALLVATGRWVGARPVEQASLLMHAAPLGVGYWVARWRVA